MSSPYKKPSFKHVAGRASKKKSHLLNSIFRVEDFIHSTIYDGAANPSMAESVHINHKQQHASPPTKRPHSSPESIKQSPVRYLSTAPLLSSPDKPLHSSPPHNNNNSAPVVPHTSPLPLSPRGKSNKPHVTKWGAPTNEEQQLWSETLQAAAANGVEQSVGRGLSPEKLSPRRMMHPHELSPKQQNQLIYAQMAAKQKQQKTTTSNAEAYQKYLYDAEIKAAKAPQLSVKQLHQAGHRTAQEMKAYADTRHRAAQASVDGLEFKPNLHVHVRTSSKSLDQTIEPFDFHSMNTPAAVQKANGVPTKSATAIPAAASVLVVASSTTATTSAASSSRRRSAASTGGMHNNGNELHSSPAASRNSNPLSPNSASAAKMSIATFLTQNTPSPSELDALAMHSPRSAELLRLVRQLESGLRHRLEELSLEFKQVKVHRERNELDRAALSKAKKLLHDFEGDSEMRDQLLAIAMAAPKIMKSSNSNTTSPYAKNVLTPPAPLPPSSAQTTVPTTTAGNGTPETEAAPTSVTSKPSTNPVASPAPAVANVVATPVAASPSVPTSTSKTTSRKSSRRSSSSRIPDPPSAQIFNHVPAPVIALSEKPASKMMMSVPPPVTAINSEREVNGNDTVHIRRSKGLTSVTQAVHAVAAFKSSAAKPSSYDSPPQSSAVSHSSNASTSNNQLGVVQTFSPFTMQKLKQGAMLDFSSAASSDDSKPSFSSATSAYASNNNSSSNGSNNSQYYSNASTLSRPLSASPLNSPHSTDSFPVLFAQPLSHSTSNSSLAAQTTNYNGNTTANAADTVPPFDPAEFLSTNITAHVEPQNHQSRVSQYATYSNGQYTAPATTGYAPYSYLQPAPAAATAPAGQPSSAVNLLKGLLSSGSSRSLLSQPPQTR